MVVILLIAAGNGSAIYRSNSTFGKPKRVAAQRPATTDLHRPHLESVKPERTDANDWIAHRPDSSTKGEGKDDHLYFFPTAPILGNGSPKVEMTLQGRTTTTLLDTGADISVLPRDLMVELVPHHAHACRLRSVQSFGGAYLTIEGPQYLTVEFCGLKAVHP